MRWACPHRPVLAARASAPAPRIGRWPQHLAQARHGQFGLIRLREALHTSSHPSASIQTRSRPALPTDPDHAISLPPPPRCGGSPPPGEPVAPAPAPTPPARPSGAPALRPDISLPLSRSIRPRRRLELHGQLTRRAPGAPQDHICSLNSAGYDWRCVFFQSDIWTPLRERDRVSPEPAPSHTGPVGPTLQRERPETHKTRGSDTPPKDQADGTQSADHAAQQSSPAETRSVRPRTRRCVRRSGRSDGHGDPPPLPPLQSGSVHPRIAAPLQHPRPPTASSSGRPWRTPSPAAEPAPEPGSHRGTGAPPQTEMHRKSHLAAACA